MNASESQNKSLARRLLEEVVNTGAVDRLSDFLAPEYVAPLLGIAGIDQAREHLLTFRRCYPDMVVTVEGQVAEGDIVATWYVMRATHLVAFGGVPATGKSITLRAVNVQRIRDGRIVEHWGGSNSLEVLLELGVVRWASDPRSCRPGSTRRCAEWRPRDAGCQFESHGGVALRDLISRPPRHFMRTHHIAPIGLIGLLAVLGMGCSRLTAELEAEVRQCFGIPADAPDLRIFRQYVREQT